MDRKFGHHLIEDFGNYEDPENMVKVVLSDGEIEILKILLVLHSNLFHQVMLNHPDDKIVVIAPDYDMNTFEKMKQLMTIGKTDFDTMDKKTSFCEFALLEIDLNHDGLDFTDVVNIVQRNTVDAFKNFPGDEDDSKRCKFCLTIFYTKYTCKRHEYCCSKNPDSTLLLKCSLCSKTYRTPEGLISHKKAKHTSIHPEKLQCPDCSSEFLNEGDLKRHQSTCKHEEEEPKKVYKCNECKYKTHRKDNMHRRQRIKHRIFKVDFETIRRSFRGNPNMTYKCPECHHIFYNADDVEHHFTLPECNELKCMKCDKKFTLKSNLKRHMKKCNKV